MKYLRIFMFLSLVLVTKQINAQAITTGTVTVLTSDSSTYTILTGQIMSIGVNGNFSGKINLNGGTIINKGIFHPDSTIFIKGRIINNGTLTLDSQVSLGANSFLSNNIGGAINIAGNLTIADGTLINNGTLSVTQDLQNNSGTLNNSHIINCDHLTGNNVITNTGTINTN
ncbi:MAG: hypothetical protein Q8L81_10330 [Bacteroidota bacterium]|nr:hypothetical protein [Bacteroidota bacterium]